MGTQKLQGRPEESKEEYVSESVRLSKECACHKGVEKVKAGGVGESSGAASPTLQHHPPSQLPSWDTLSPRAEDQLGRLRELC